MAMKTDNETMDNHVHIYRRVHKYEYTRGILLMISTKLEKQDLTGNIK